MLDIERVKKVVDWLIYEKIIQSKRNLAEILGYSESSLSQILNKKVPLSERFIKKLCIIDDRINIDWLLTGDGEMLRVGESVIGNSVNDTRVAELERALLEKEERISELKERVRELKECISLQREIISELKKETSDRELLRQAV